MNVPMPDLQLISELGLAVYLALFFSIGVFLAAIWLVKYIVKSHERERANGQALFTESLKNNTGALVNMSERLSDIANIVGRITENLSRIETADKYQREEHQKMVMALNKIDTEVDNLHDKLRG